MRPDQHKKKKNSAYKKKHGITSDKGEKQDKKEPTGGHRSEGASPSASGEANLETDDVNVNFEQHDSQERRTFSRRKVENNWDRYKDDDFEDEFDPNGASSVSSDPVGADYQSLLDNAASASSHFQFKSEKEWGNLPNDDQSNKAGPSLMSIDCHALAQSLRNIPLEERLEIDKKYFEHEYQESNPKKKQLDKPMINHDYNNDLQTTKIYSENRIGKRNSTALPNVNNTNVGFSQHKKLSKASDKIETDKTKHNSTEEKIEQNGDINVPSAKPVHEDDLELLLGFDNNTELNSMCRGNQSGNQAASSCTNKSEATSTVQKPQTIGDTKEDLEDWLDSILD